MKIKKLVIDYSGLATYRTCPRKFLYALVRRRAPVAPSDALSFGQCIHKALAVWHTGGEVGTLELCEHNFKEFEDLGSTDYRIPHTCVRCRSLAAFVESAKETNIVNLTPETARSVHHGLNLLWHYFRIYGDPFSSFAPINTQEMKPAVELTLTAPLRLSDRATEIWYRGTIDAAVTELSTEKIVGLEHKTTYYLNEAFLNRARLNDQVTGYIHLLRENVHPDIDTMIWNALQTAPRKIQTDPGACFARTSTRRTREQLQDWRENTICTCRRILHDLEEESYETDMPNGCVQWNSMCPFADVCNAPSAVREEILLSNYVDNPWEGHAIEVAE